ncbi:MAG: AAA family ATPase [Desulfobacterales bacterium]|jgi:general secretion pathway protein A
MYERFFGFKERPFRLVPDPAYMFLGKSHREAMAHLVYAVHAGDGFVELTGEVGTGKTTLCRAFLDQLEGDTETAFIFNPPADPIDLLQAVNRDFGIATESDRLQHLIEELNAFLIDQRRKDKHVLLMIDEAQNLNPHVLEQIRLLSNLETASGKLLQIILVGQPELHETLQSKALRQLRQRITLSCRLQPLSLPETEAYIRHRLQVASTNGRPVFTRGAVRRVFRFSAGIPRLINMACDRALLQAFTLNRHKVGAKSVAKAVEELRSSRTGASGRRGRWAWIGAAVAAVAVAAFIASNGPVLREIRKGLQAAPSAENRKADTPRLPVPKPSPSNTVAESVSAPAAVSTDAEVETAQSLADWVRTADTERTRSLALQELVRRWVPEAGDLRLPEHLQDDTTFFQISAGQAGLSVYAVDEPELLPRLGLPAIVAVGSDASAARGFVVLSGIESGRYVFNVPGRDESVFCEPAELEQLWSGPAHVLWKNFFAISGTIPGASPGESVITLKLLLRDLGYDGVDLSPAYDDNTRMAVMDVQARQNLPVDGVVGPMTKIALYNLKQGLPIPKLNTGAAEPAQVPERAKL